MLQLYVLIEIAGVHGIWIYFLVLALFLFIKYLHFKDLVNSQVMNIIRKVETRIYGESLDKKLEERKKWKTKK